MAMDIEFDPKKQRTTLDKRQLDFARAGEIFDGPHLTRMDDREDYGEDRFITAGWLDGRIVLVTWTPRGDDVTRIISMRKANERERKKLAPHLV
ncbi:MAG: BrnT family toxin [Azonexus sp.]|jgi:uncharacterized DUF497 family protein|nr:BrnT family toxin [Azonexus sp.]